MNDYNLIECSIMGIADYIYSKSKVPPKWMNKRESAAWNIGYKRAIDQCK